MKRIIALILCCTMLFSGCVQVTINKPDDSNETGAKETNNTQAEVESTDVESTTQASQRISFTGMEDPSLLSYVEDTVYSNLIATLNNDGYFVENVEGVFISKEYIEELSYNSQENIYFGYTLSELEKQFEGKRFVFTLGEDGHTAVTEFEKYDDTYDQVIKNVAIGTGVILLCVTVSAVSAGVGAPAVSMIFAASAKTGAAMALSSGALGGISAGIIKGIETGDFDEAVKAAAVAGSESFKWGAITGAVSGGASKAIALKGATLNGLTMNQAAQIQKESGYPLDVIKQFKSMEQYNICKDAGLTPQMINGKMALVRNLDLDFTDEMGRTNLERMLDGKAALDPATGEAYQLHHIGQKADSTLAILSRAEHMQGGNDTIWHEWGKATEVHGAGNTWDAQREAFWKALAEMMGA